MRRAGNAARGVDLEAQALTPSGLDTSLDSLSGDAHQAFLSLSDAATAAGLAFSVRSTRRTCAQQNELFRIGRDPGDTRQIVTKARGCISWHVLGRAVDVTMTQGSYADFGALAKSMGWKWGGDFPKFPDVGHVEYHPGKTIEEVCPDPLACSDDMVDTTWPVGGQPPPPGPADTGAPSDAGALPLLALTALSVVGLAWLYERARG